MIHTIPYHKTLPDMPSATNSDHDGRYLNLDSESINITNGTFDLTTTGKGTFGELDVDTLNFNGNVITDSTGTISLDNEHLTTSGKGTFGEITVDNLNFNGNLIKATGKLQLDSSINTYQVGSSETEHDTIWIFDGDNAQTTFFHGGTAGPFRITTSVGDIELNPQGCVRVKDNTDLNSNKYKLTAIGGYAIKLTNETGGNTVAGQLVVASFPLGVDTDDAFETAAADEDNVIGIVLDAGIAEHAEAWVVVSGIADVLMDAGGSIRGDRIISSGTAGSADVWNVGGAVATHFLEIGHCIETRTGAGLARVVIHFL